MHKMSFKSGKKYFAIKIRSIDVNTVVCIGFACINFLLSPNDNECKDNHLGMDNLSWAVSSDNGKKDSGDDMLTVIGRTPCGIEFLKQV